MSDRGDRIREGIEYGGKGAVVGGLVGFVGWAGTHGVFELWPALLAIPGAALGYLYGYVQERSSQRAPMRQYRPGSAMNPHPFQSSLWYQHEQLMQSERDEDRRNRAS